MTLDVYTNKNNIWRGDGRDKSQRVAPDIFIRLRHSYTWWGAGGAHILTDCTQPTCTYLWEVTRTVSCAPIQLEWRDQYLCPLSRPVSAEWCDRVAGAFPNTPSATPPPPIRKGRFGATLTWKHTAPHRCRDPYGAGRFDCLVAWGCSSASSRLELHGLVFVTSSF